MEYESETSEIDSMLAKGKGYQEVRFELFPGFFLDYFFCDGSYVFKHLTSSITDILLINHCYRGGFEAIMRNGKHMYRGEGETTLSCPASIMTHSRLPQTVYEGISLCIDIRQIPDWLQRLLVHMDIDIRRLIQRYDLKTCWFCVPENEQIRTLMKHLYQQMESGNINLLRLTSLNLINCFSNLGEQGEKRPQNLPQKTSRIVHKICQRMEDPELFTVPLTELIDEEGISYTVFQKVFKELYHMTPSQYRKKHRLNHGAYLLKSTQLSVMEVAAFCGYDNASKFSAAFKDLMGFSPLAYKRHESITITE